MERRAWLIVLLGAAGCRQLFGIGDPGLDPGLIEDAPSGFETIGGSVTGLTGVGLVLQNNGGDDKLIASSGVFQLPSAIPDGASYAVTVGTQPTNPSQTCVVGNGTGIATADVNNVSVVCTGAKYLVGGTVVGCGGSCANTLVLTDNLADDKLIAGNGAFQFATPVASGSPYAVAVKNGIACSVTGGMGIVGNANITSIVVNCTANTYTVGGMPPTAGVSGLDGTVVLHATYAGPAAPSDTIAVSSNSFAFPTPLINNQTYAVTVGAQPAYPPAAQACLVNSGSGTINGANVTTVTVVCTTTKFNVGGMVSGLVGSVVLRNNFGDPVSIASNGSFMFPTSLPSGVTYAASVFSQPSGHTCTVANGNGTVTNSAVTSIVVTCQ